MYSHSNEGQVIEEIKNEQEREADQVYTYINALNFPVRFSYDILAYQLGTFDVVDMATNGKFS